MTLFKGVKIRCRNGFKLGKSYTDINGNFECNNDISTQ